MTMPIKEPAVFTAGDTLAFKRLVSDYAPADGWTLEYTLVSLDATVTFSSTDNGDGYHLVSVSPATTKKWQSGEYKWQAKATAGADPFTVGTGTIKIAKDYSDADRGLDDRSHAEKVLAALRAALEKKATKDQLSITIAGTQISRLPPGDLLKWLNYYERLLRSEREAESVANGLGSSRKIRVRF